MPDYRDSLQDLGPMPKIPFHTNIRGISIGEADAQNAQAEQELWKLAASERLKQASSPFRGQTLNDIARFTERDPRDLAAHDQFHDRPVTEPSAVPSYRYMPTLSDTPELQSPQMRPQYQQSTGQMVEQPRPNISYTSHEPNLDAPANLAQMQLGESYIARSARWPRGTGLLNAKIQALKDSGMSEHDAQQFAILGGLAGDKQEAMRSRTDYTNTQNEMAPRRMQETERHNQMMEQGAAEARRFAHEYHNNQKAARDRGDTMAQERLDFAYEKHHDLLDRYDAANKNGTLTPEMAEDLKKGLTSSSNFMFRDPNEDELTLLERLGIKDSRPRIQTAPRTPPSARRPKTGQAPVAAGSFEGAPAGKAPGDTLKENGKPVAQWDGKAWQRMK